MGKQAACQLTRAPMHSDRLIKNHLAGSAQQWGGLHHSMGSRCPFGQKEKQCVSIHLNLCQRGPQSKAQGPQKLFPAPQAKQRSSPLFSVQSAPAAALLPPSAGTLAAHARAQLMPVSYQAWHQCFLFLLRIHLKCCIFRISSFQFYVGLSVCSTQ